MLSPMVTLSSNYNQQINDTPAMVSCSYPHLTGVCWEINFSIFFYGHKFEHWTKFIWILVYLCLFYSEEPTTTFTPSEWETSLWANKPSGKTCEKQRLEERCWWCAQHWRRHKIVLFIYLKLIREQSHLILALYQEWCHYFRTAKEHNLNSHEWNQNICLLYQIIL